MIDSDTYYKGRTPQELQQYIVEVRKHVEQNDEITEQACLKKELYKQFLEEMVPFSQYCAWKFPDNNVTCKLIKGNQGYDAIIEGHAFKEYVEITSPIDGEKEALRKKKIKAGTSIFHEEEFDERYPIEDLINALNTDGITVKDNSVKALNRVLTQQNIYGIFMSKYPHCHYLHKERVRDAYDSYINNPSESTLQKLNRMTLEAFYPRKTPSSSGIEVWDYMDFSEIEKAIDRLIIKADEKSIKNYYYEESTLIIALSIIPYFELERDDHNAKIQELRQRLEEKPYKVKSVYLVLLGDRERPDEHRFIKVK